MSNFQSKLDQAVAKNNSLLCIGLDQSDFNVNKKIIDQTADLVCAYKPNIAFYEAQGPEGLENLKKTIDYIHKNYPDIPVILDAKRGDVPSTSQAYARSAFDYLGADAITANPYLGLDSLKPFLERKEKGVIVICRTSNEGAGDFQDLKADGQPLYLKVAQKVNEWNKQYGNLLMVVGATWPEQLKEVRSIVPDMTILVPGIGAQGGDIKATLENGLTKNKSGLIISASRSIIGSQDPRKPAQDLRDEINKYR